MIRRVKNGFALAIALGLGFAPEPYPPQAAPTTPETVWYWSGTDCPESKTLGVELLLDGEPIYRSSFTICRMERSEVRPKQGARMLAFSFKGGYIFRGQQRTTRKETIEGNIWQAGVEPDGLLLGVSFSTKDRVLLNTVHLAMPDRASESTLDPGLRIRTYPASRSRPR